jgi:hypothetical protein
VRLLVANESQVTGHEGYLRLIRNKLSVDTYIRPLWSHIKEPMLRCQRKSASELQLGVLEFRQEHREQRGTVRDPVYQNALVYRVRAFAHPA